MRFGLTLSFVGLCVWLSPVAHADIYTWTDAAGRVNVSNIAPPDAARITHVTRDISPKPDAAASRDNAEQNDVRALADRVRQLEQELDVAKIAPTASVPVPTPPPPAVVTIWNYVAPPVSPVADAAFYAQPSYGACDFNCAPAWVSSAYPAGVASIGTPALRRPYPFHPAARRASLPPLPYVAMGKLPLTFVH